MKFPNWHDRPERFSPGEAANGKLDGHHFIQMADQFISLAVSYTHLTLPTILLV